MKNILKWFTGFLIVILLITGLKMAKFSLLRPPEIKQMADYKRSFGGPPYGQDGPSPAFHLNGPGPERHPPFGPPTAGMEWAFALADLIDLLIYALVLLPLFYGAYLLGKRTLHLQRHNTAIAPTLSSFKLNDKLNEQNPAESNPVSSRQSNYLVSDNHILDQLL